MERSNCQKHLFKFHRQEFLEAVRQVRLNKHTAPSSLRLPPGTDRKFQRYEDPEAINQHQHPAIPTNNDQMAMDTGPYGLVALGIAAEIVDSPSKRDWNSFLPDFQQHVPERPAEDAASTTTAESDSLPTTPGSIDSIGTPEEDSSLPLTPATAEFPPPLPLPPPPAVLPQPTPQETIEPALANVPQYNFRNTKRRRVRQPHLVHLPQPSSMATIAP
jgi:hypothetical protein